MTSETAALYDATHAALAQVIREDGSLPSLNETETRTYIIDPVVVALGYRTPDHVRREYRLEASGQVVDYLLVAGEQRAVIEAKQAGNELAPKDASQLVGYCAQEGVRWALLTNGLVWTVFDIEVSGNWEAKRVATIDLLAAYRSQTLADALAPLSYFARDRMRVDDSSLRAWAHEERARTLLDDLLSDPESSVVGAAVSELQKAGVHLEREDVVSVLRRGTAREIQQAQPPEAQALTPSVTASKAAYAFPAAEDAGFSGLEHLRMWLNKGYWGVRRNSAFRERLREGNGCCFYATGVGIVGKATIAGSAQSEVTRAEWPGPGSYSPEVFKLPLRDVSWLDAPIPIDAPMRSQLDAFRGKDLTRPWSWFVFSTSRISQHDLDLLTGNRPRA